MSAKCQWCRRKRPEVTVKLDDDRELNVCSNCQTIIEANRVFAREKARREGDGLEKGRPGEVAQ